MYVPTEETPTPRPPAARHGRRARVSQIETTATLESRSPSSATSATSTIKPARDAQDVRSKYSTADPPPLEDSKASAMPSPNRRRVNPLPPPVPLKLRIPKQSYRQIPRYTTSRSRCDAPLILPVELPSVEFSSDWWIFPPSPYNEAEYPVYAPATPPAEAESTPRPSSN